MTVQNSKKLNQIEQILPQGLLVDAAWLEDKGYSRSLRSQYVSAGWLKQPTRGVFCRPHGEIGWEQVVISLQALLGYQTHIGGRTALELQGYAHYVSRSPKTIHLYHEINLPSWLYKLPIKQQFVLHNQQRLFIKTGFANLKLSLESAKTQELILEGGFRMAQWGQWNWPLIMSTPERAFLELLDELPKNETFHMADTFMEGLTNLSPRRMQSLLEQIKSIKVKRLFFFFAERHQHQWLKHIRQKKINLGRGKRLLIKGGKLDAKYQITVPEELHGVQ